MALTRFNDVLIDLQEVVFARREAGIDQKLQLNFRNGWTSTLYVSVPSVWSALVDSSKTRTGRNEDDDGDEKTDKAPPRFGAEIEGTWWTEEIRDIVKEHRQWTGTGAELVRWLRKRAGNESRVMPSKFAIIDMLKQHAFALRQAGIDMQIRDMLLPEWPGDAWINLTWRPFDAPQAS